MAGPFRLKLLWLSSLHTKCEEERKKKEEGPTVGGQRQRLRNVLARVHVREHALVLEVVVGYAPSADLPCLQDLGLRVNGLGFGV